jgi:hypothetical protein
MHERFFGPQPIAARLSVKGIAHPTTPVAGERPNHYSDCRHLMNASAVIDPVLRKKILFFAIIQNGW